MKQLYNQQQAQNQQQQLLQQQQNEIKIKQEQTANQLKEKVSAAKSYIEQKYSKKKEDDKISAETWGELQSKMEGLSLSAQEQEELKNQILHEQAEKMRKKRMKMHPSDFEPIAIIGRGAFGEVRLCKQKKTNEIVAIKKMKKQDMVLKNQVTHIRAERDVLAQAENQWIVDLKCSFQDDSYLYLVMEYLAGGDLMTLLMKKDILSEQESKFFIAEAILAVDSVHKLNYIHRDLKPDNILIGADGHVKLSDFGLCKHTEINPSTFIAPHGTATAQQQQNQNTNSSQNQTNIIGQKNAQNFQIGKRHGYRRNRKLAFSTVGTPDYIAPEVFGKEGYNETVDFWSLGVILFEMLVGYPPFFSEDPSLTCQKILHWRKTLIIPKEANLSAPAEDIIRKLVTDQSERLGINGVEEIKAHPFFAGIDWKNIKNKKSPYIPELSGPLDVRYFDKFEEEETWLPEQSELPQGKQKKQRKDANFIGYTYNRGMEDQKSSIVNALNKLEQVRPSQTRQQIQTQPLKETGKQNQQPQLNLNTYQTESSVITNHSNQVSERNNNNNNNNIQQNQQISELQNYINKSIQNMPNQQQQQHQTTSAQQQSSQSQQPVNQYQQFQQMQQQKMQLQAQTGTAGSGQKKSPMILPNQVQLNNALNTNSNLLNNSSQINSQPSANSTNNQQINMQQQTQMQQQNKVDLNNFLKKNISPSFKQSLQQQQPQAYQQSSQVQQQENNTQNNNSSSNQNFNQQQQTRSGAQQQQAKDYSNLSANLQLIQSQLQQAQQLQLQRASQMQAQQAQVQADSNQNLNPPSIKEQLSKIAQAQQTQQAQQMQPQKNVLPNRQQQVNAGSQLNLNLAAAKKNFLGQQQQSLQTANTPSQQQMFKTTGQGMNTQATGVQQQKATIDSQQQQLAQQYSKLYNTNYNATNLNEHNTKLEQNSNKNFQYQSQKNVTGGQQQQQQQQQIGQTNTKNVVQNMINQQASQQQSSQYATGGSPNVNLNYKMQAINQMANNNQFKTNYQTGIGSLYTKYGLHKY